MTQFHSEISTLETLIGGIALIPAILLLVLFPRPLFRALDGQSPTSRREQLCFLTLLIIGLAVLELAPAAGPIQRWTIAVAVMTLAAIVYADFRYLIIPDLYTAVIGAAAVISPLDLPWRQVLIGALICGALLGLVAMGYRLLRHQDGMGHGDIKFAAALGGLLGPLAGVQCVAIAAIGASVATVAVLGIRRRSMEGPLLVPFGAALAAVSAWMLLWPKP